MLDRTQVNDANGQRLRELHAALDRLVAKALDTSFYGELALTITVKGGNLHEFSTSPLQRERFSS